MKKSEVIEQINNFRDRLDDCEAELESAINSLRSAIRLLNRLPESAEDIDNDNDETN